MPKKVIILTAALIATLFFSCCKTLPPNTAAVDDIAALENDAEQEVEEAEDDDFTFFTDNAEDIPHTDWEEVWCYVVAGYEKTLKSSLPITDVVYFGAEVDRYGKIVDIPRRRALPKSSAQRVHVSIACNSAGLTHFLLENESPARKRFFAELVAMTNDYDGLNIDLEYVPLQDGKNFLALLSDLKTALGDKMLSVCVAARDKELTETAYDYKKIAQIADRVFVMAYDEHWSGSAPGSVASMAWCKRVGAFSLKSIGADKLVMGLPFYGRSWADKTTARALVAQTTKRVMEEHGIMEVEREKGVPKFTYTETVKVTVYFEDTASLAARLLMYNEAGINKAGFWRLGQEDTAVWGYMGVKEK